MSSRTLLAVTALALLVLVGAALVAGLAYVVLTATRPD